MKSLLALGMISLSLSFCNFMSKNKNDNGNSNNKNSSTTSSGDVPTAEKPKPTKAQSDSVENGLSVSWNDQGMNWTLPVDWKEVDSKKESLLYTSPDNASLIVNISPLADNFPVDASINAYYTGKAAEMKNGKIEELRMLELDGVKGVQWREVMPEEKTGPRRLQWIAYRTYGGQVQQVNVMLASDGDKFEKHLDAFYGILYSTRLKH